MARRVVAALWIALLVPAVAAGAEAVDPETVARLGSPDWRQRGRAVAELGAQGAAAEPALRELIRHTRDPDVVRGLNLALERIRFNARFGPSLVTLHESQIKPRALFDELSRQGSAPIPAMPDKLLDEPDWPAVSLDVECRPLWDVIDQACGRLGMQYLSTETQTMRLTRGVGRKSPAVSTHGAFLVAVDLYPSFSRLNVELTVFGEPKVVVLRAAGLRLEDARDDHGHPLVPQVGRRGFGGMGFGRRGRTGSRRIFLPFQHPLDEATRIARFAGSLTVTVEASSGKWKLPDPLSMPASTRIIDSIPVTLESMTRNATGDTYQLRASIPYGRTDRAAQDEITELMRTRLRVLDVHGQPLSIGGIDTYRTADGMEMSAEVTRPTQAGDTPGGPPAKIVWDVPDETLALTVPFEFKDLSFDDAFQ